MIMFIHTVHVLRNYEYDKYLLTFQHEFRSSWEVSVYLQHLFKWDVHPIPHTTDVAREIRTRTNLANHHMYIRIAGINKWWTYYSLIAGLLSSIYIYIYLRYMASSWPGMQPTDTVQLLKNNRINKKLQQKLSLRPKKIRHVLFGAHKRRNDSQTFQSLNLWYTQRPPLCFLNIYRHS